METRLSVMEHLLSAIEVGLEDDTTSPEKLEILGKLLAGVAMNELRVRRIE